MNNNDNSNILKKIKIRDDNYVMLSVHSGKKREQDRPEHESCRT